ncbi:MAG: sugar porter family MFS transporter [Thermoguttaceae bacterium]
MQSPNSQGILPTRYNMRYVWAISLVAALGGLMFGYDWIVIGGAEPFYERFLNLQSASEKGWAMGSALVGCLLGAILSGGLSDKLGRKWLLVFSAIVFVISSIGTGLVNTFLAFNLWRMAGGVAIGMASNLSPMYIAEIAPAAVRGRLVAMNQFTIVIGILLAQVVNFGIAGYGAHLDKKAVDEHAIRNGKALDAKKVAEELTWQVPQDQRKQLVLDFTRLADERGGTLDFAAVEQIIKPMSAKRLEQKLAKVVAHRDAVELAGRGLTSWNVAPGWRWMFGATAAPACLFFLLMFFVPESPRWLVKNGKSSQARRVLARVGGGDFADREVANIEGTLVGEIEKVNFRDLLEPRMFKILAFGVILAVLQQWCGMNVIFYYATKIFQDAGWSVNDALFNIVIIGAVNLVFTVIAINSVDRVGRRILMLIGFVGLALLHVLIGASYFSGFSSTFVLLLTLAAIGMYALTLAPVVWVVLSEIFPNRIRGAAMSVSVFSLWTACFLLTYTYPLLAEGIGTANTFWVYAAICAVGFVFTLRNLPETKGKTLEEIEKELVD